MRVQEDEPANPHSLRSAWETGARPIKVQMVFTNRARCRIIEEVKIQKGGLFPMKKFAALFLALIMALSMTAALAEGADTIDLSGKTAEELIALIDQARNALAELMPPLADGEVLYEDENVTITLNGAPSIEYGSLVLPIIIVNHTDRNLLISMDNVSINGWDVSGGTTSVSASKKARTEIDFYDAEEAAELKDVADLEDVTGKLSYFDEDDWNWDFEGTSVTWTFAK